jgi:putative endonuclease
MARRADPAGPRHEPRRERVAAFRLGLSAESRAAMFLIAKGYRIVARRWKTPSGEIDIVAAEAVTERGKRRIVAAAELWLAHNRDDAQREIRFDVVLVTAGKMPQHIANAFDATR